MAIRKRRRPKRPNTDKIFIGAGRVFQRTAVGAGIVARAIKTKTESTRENIKRRRKGRIEVIKY